MVLLPVNRGTIPWMRKTLQTLLGEWRCPSIYLQRGDAWGQARIVRCEDHVVDLHVSDIVTHVNHKRLVSTTRVADAIVRSGPSVTVTVLRGEMYRPLLLE